MVAPCCWCQPPFQPFSAGSLLCLAPLPSLPFPCYRSCCWRSCRRHCCRHCCRVALLYGTLQTRLIVVLGIQYFYSCLALVILFCCRSCRLCFVSLPLVLLLGISPCPWAPCQHLTWLIVIVIFVLYYFEPVVLVSAVVSDPAVAVLLWLTATAQRGWLLFCY